MGTRAQEPSIQTWTSYIEINEKLDREYLRLFVQSWQRSYFISTFMLKRLKYEYKNLIVILKICSVQAGLLQGWRGNV